MDIAIVGDVKSSLRTMVKMLSKQVVKKDPAYDWLKRRKDLKDYYTGKYKGLY